MQQTLRSTIPHIFKSAIIVSLLFLSLPGCKKETDALPSCDDPAASSQEKTIPTDLSRQNTKVPDAAFSSTTTYCYKTVQTSLDSWKVYVYQYLGSTSTVASYFIHYDYYDAVTNTTTPSGWIPVSSFPYSPGGTGFGGGVRNIQIKETRCINTPWGTNCSDTYYSVPRCP